MAQSQAAIGAKGQPIMRRAFSFVKYVLVGVMGTAVQYAILIVLTTSNMTGAVLASTVGAAAGAVVNYVLNYRLTFESTARHMHAAPRFFCVATLGMAANAALMSTLVNHLHMHYLIAQCLSTGCVLVLGFVVNSAWSFRAAHAR
ncbi:MAG: GtrA family protein [Paraburkholderia sp.]|uniref:GtrA family protein n=1 Tax=Paraburkholderia sp. TaxID=1926495 RepID=UPI003C42B516